MIMEHPKSKLKMTIKEKDVEQMKLNGWTEVKAAKRPIVKPKEGIENG